MDHLDRATGWLVAPKVIEQALDRDRASGIEQQAREHGALLATAERHRHATGADLKRPEDAEVGRRLATLPDSRAGRQPPAGHLPSDYRELNVMACTAPMNTPTNRTQLLGPRTLCPIALPRPRLGRVVAAVA